VRFDLLATGGKAPEDRGREPFQLGHALLHRAEADAQGVGQPGPQRRLVKEAGGAGVVVKETGVGG
jgi:hypothetical protein